MIILNHWRTLAALIGTLSIGITLFLAVSATNDVRDSTDRIRAGNRTLCDGTNRLRENQASGLAFQIAQTEESLKRDLGPALEPFREQIVTQHERRKKQLEALRMTVDDHPAFDRRGRLLPYTLNCRHLFP
jgi:hypothetical protein